VIRVLIRGMCGLTRRQQIAFNNCRYERRRKLQNERRSSDDAERQELDWKFGIEQVMRANNILDILDGSLERPIKITETDMNGRMIMKNKKEIDHWNGLDGWAMSILSTSVEPALMEEHVDIVTRIMDKTEGYLRTEIRGIEASSVGSLLRH